MILAAADFADDPDHNEPPRELELMFECKDLPGSLPARGGLTDQTAGLIRRMRVAYNTWCAVSDWRDAKDKATWSQKNPERWKIVQLVIMLRENRYP